VLKGRLGLETARIPQADRQGVLWLSRGNLYVESGTLRFKTVGGGELPSGDYAIAFQMVSAVLLAPGTTVSHDALRLLARHGTGLVAIGEGGTRFYASMPFGADASALARRQAKAWADPGERLRVARVMYGWRFGEVLPDESIDVLRGIEGARMRESYRLLAERYEIDWSGRKYDRGDPTAADPPNQAINHASSAVESAAMVAVALVGALPQLGFIHEDSSNAFTLDIADLYRTSVTIPAAFSGVKACQKDIRIPLERAVRRAVGAIVRKQDVVPSMIEKVKALFDADDRRRDA
jgi:CRISPR-associated protein Cas1